MPMGNKEWMMFSKRKWRESPITVEFIMEGQVEKINKEQMKNYLLKLHPSILPDLALDLGFQEDIVDTLTGKGHGGGGRGNKLMALGDNYFSMINQIADLIQVEGINMVGVMEAEVLDALKSKTPKEKLMGLKSEVQWRCRNISEVFADYMGFEVDTVDKMLAEVPTPPHNIEELAVMMLDNLPLDRLRY